MSLPTPQELQEACQDMPLFPLPNISLIPFTILRLHVFEPRYVQLLKDCMESNKLMAIPCFAKGWDEIESKPKLEPVSGVGLVAQMKELPDDRYLIILMGVGRILILGEHEQLDPYRRAYGELLLEPEEDTDRYTIMRELFVQLLIKNPALSKNLRALLDEEIQPTHMCNALANIVIQDPDLRQQFLCAETLSERCELVILELTKLLLDNSEGFDS